MLVFQAAIEKDASTGVVQIVYLLPFLLFSGYSGYLADVPQQTAGPDRGEGLRDRCDGLGRLRDASAATCS